MEFATKSTSTLHYVTSSDVSTQTQRSLLPCGGENDSDTDTDSDNSNDSDSETETDCSYGDFYDANTSIGGDGGDEEMEVDDDDVTERKRLTLSSPETRPTNDGEREEVVEEVIRQMSVPPVFEGARRCSREREGDGGGGGRGAPNRTCATEAEQRTAAEGGGHDQEAEVTIPAAVNNVQIVQNQTVVNNNYLQGTVRYDWGDIVERIMAEKSEREGERMTSELKSIQRSMKKEMKRNCKSTWKSISRRLLHSQSVEATHREQQQRCMAHQQEEIARQQRRMEEQQRKWVETQQAIMDRMKQLEAEKEEARRRERESQSYVLKLGEKQKRVLERVWASMEESRFVQLMKRLYRQFKVKLQQVSVHCGMQFVVTVPPEQQQQQAEIQQVIMEEVVPDNFQEEVEWQPPVALPPPQQQQQQQLQQAQISVAQADLAIPSSAELGMPVQVSEEQEGVSSSAGAGASDVDQLVPLMQEEPSRRPSPLQHQTSLDTRTLVARRSFEIDSSSGGPADVNNSCVTSLVMTSSGLLVMADNINMKVRCTALHPTTAAGGEEGPGPASPVPGPGVGSVSCLALSRYPWDMAVYQGDLVAVATDTCVLFLIHVSSEAITTTGRVCTDKAYRSVASFGDGALLVVGKVRDCDGPAVVDVITREGKVMWRLLDNCPHLQCPSCLHVCNRQVLVADTDGSKILMVDAFSEFTPPALLTHPELREPCQVTTDAAGTALFTTGSAMNGVLVMPLPPPPQSQSQSTLQHHWRQLLTVLEHGEGDYVQPRALGVSEDGGVLVVSWAQPASGRTVVIAYQLSDPS